MEKLSLKYVYQNLSSEEKKQIINLWLRNGVLDITNAQQRVEQVSVVILNKKEEIIGVSTVYINDFTMPNNPYFFFRMFIQEEYRGSNKLRTDTMKLNFKKLKEEFEHKVHGLVIELENEKLAKFGDETKYFQKRGYTYYGKSARGLQMWYVRFDEPKGIFTK